MLLLLLLLLSHGKSMSPQRNYARGKKMKRKGKEKKYPARNMIR